MGLAGRCRFGAHVAVLTTALLFTVSEAVSVTFVNSSYVYADSEFYRVVLTHANLTMYYRNRRGNIPGDKVEVSFSSFAEQFRWGTTPNASGSEATYDTVCTDSFSSGEYIFNHVAWAQGPEGSIILQGNYSFGVPGSNCTVLRQYYVTDKIVTINVAVCPWREQLQKLLHAGPSEPLYLRARQSKFRFKLDIYFSSSFASYPTPIVSRDNLTIPSEWYLYAQQQCAFASNFTSDGELSLSGRPLVPDFNFTETAGILVENEQFFTGFLFLMWARSDYRQFTRASARASDTDLQFNVDSNHLGLNGNVSFEFYNVLEYDPTLQLLFTGTDPGVDNPPQTETPQTIAINNENLSAGLIAAIAVPIVVVVACAVIIVALIVVSRRQASDRQLLARKLQQGQRAIKDSTHTGTEAPPKTSRKSSQTWVKSEKPTN